MKKKYSKPQTICILVNIGNELLLGSGNPYGDAKKNTFYDESITSDRVAGDELPHYSAWDE